MNQLDIFDAPVARSDDLETSWEAARSVTSLSDKHAAVLRTLRRIGGGTDADITRFYKGPEQSPSGLRTRRHELVDLGLVRDSGRTKLLATGRKSVVWEAV